MERSDWLLKIIAAAKGGRLTPVQLQKVAFLVGAEFDKERLGDYYDFRKYDYGPLSADVYADAVRLEDAGLIDIVINPRGGWREYSATLRGLDAADSLQHDEVVEFIEEKVAWARQLSFTQLVRAIYKDFPDYRENSVFQG